MTMARVSKNLGFTVPPRMAEEFERVALEEGSTKSELFRRMFRLYQSYRKPIKRQFEATDTWVERLILEAQEEERRNPMTAEAFKAESKRLAGYGEERLNAMGLAGLTDEQLMDQVNDIIHAERQKRR